jgi:hypothetical protein
MTYYVPTSTSKVIHEITAAEAAPQRQELQATWPALADALADLLVANHLSVPAEWRTS